jgi:hypothetical protein
VIPRAYLGDLTPAQAFPFALSLPLAPFRMLARAPPFLPVGRLAGDERGRGPHSFIVVYSLLVPLVVAALA